MSRNPWQHSQAVIGTVKPCNWRRFQPVISRISDSRGAETATAAIDERSRRLQYTSQVCQGQPQRTGIDVEPFTVPYA